MKPLLITSGEPAGIGPDLCLALADLELPIVILGDIHVLEERARRLNLSIQFINYSEENDLYFTTGTLNVLHSPCPNKVSCGKLDKANSVYVIQLLTKAAQLCSQGIFSGIVTAPVHKAIINEAGIAFTGHTEFFAEYFKVGSVVMMLAYNNFRVALMTTHLPLRSVPDAITVEHIDKVIQQVHNALVNNFNIPSPIIKVAGLNPHAGESGYLGSEEIDIIQPAIKSLQKKGLNILGPLPADTMFDRTDKLCDAYVAMYHDQGLPVLKYAGFHKAVNITLGLPIIRTSVDHGTALEIAGSGVANPGSLIAATEMALTMAKNGNKL